MTNTSTNRNKRTNSNKNTGSNPNKNTGSNPNPENRHSLFSRILAVGGIVVILALYIATLLLAIFDRSETMSMFLASVVCTIVVPVLLYIYNWIYRLLKKDREEKEEKAAEKRDISDIIQTAAAKSGKDTGGSSETEK